MTKLNRLLTLGAAFAALATASAVQADPQVEKSIKVGPGLYEIVFNPVNGDIYIASTGPRGSNEAKVFQLDAESLEQVAAIDVAEAPLYGLGLNARTQTLYGTATRGGAVSAIDLATGAVTTFAEGEGAHVREVVIDEASGRAYVSVVGGAADREEGEASAIWIVENNAISRVLEVDVASLTGIQIDAANNRAFGTAMGSAEVVVIDLSSGEVTQRFAAGAERPTNLVYDAAGNRLFVANQGGGNLTVLNAETGELLNTVPTGEGALSVAYNPAIKQVYVANRAAGTVTVIDSDSYVVLANLQTGTFPQTIAIDRETNRVFVTNKARGLPRGAEPGTPVPEDPTGDTVTVIVP